MDIADDAVIHIAGNAVDKGIQHPERRKADDSGESEKPHIVQVKEEQQAADHGEGKNQVQSGHHQRQIKDRKQLAVDAPPDLGLGHPHLLHNAKAGLILVPLRDLLIVMGKEKRHKRETKVC